MNTQSRKKWDEEKSFPFELKSTHDNQQGQGIIEGYLSTYGNIDHQKDRVLAGAFKKTITEAHSRMQHKNKRHLWPVLWMHDPDKPIGFVTDAKEGEAGLFITAQLDISTSEHGIPNNPLATMIFSGFKAGYIDEFSMGYKALQKEYDQDGVRNLKEVQIWEASAVTSLFAANSEARAIGVKTHTEEKEKDFAELYVYRQLCNLLHTGWHDLSTSLRDTCIEALKTGNIDSIQTALEQFSIAVTSWAKECAEAGATAYLSSGQDYYYSSRSDKQELKARRMSRSAYKQLTAHASTLKGIASQHELSHKVLALMADEISALVSVVDSSSSEESEPPKKALTQQPERSTVHQEEDLAHFISWLQSKNTSREDINT